MRSFLETSQEWLSAFLNLIVTCFQKNWREICKLLVRLEDIFNNAWESEQINNSASVHQDTTLNDS